MMNGRDHMGGHYDIAPVHNEHRMKPVDLATEDINRNEWNDDPGLEIRQKV